MKYPKIVWRALSSDDHVRVGCRAFCFRIPALVKYKGTSSWYLLRGIVLKSAPGSIFMGKVITCNVVWKEMFPSDAISVMRLPSLSLGWDLITEK